MLFQQFVGFFISSSWNNNSFQEEDYSSRNRQHPVTMNEQGVALVSGCTPRLFAMAAGKTVTPMRLMLDVLESERYAAIAA